MTAPLTWEGWASAAWGSAGGIVVIGCPLLAEPLYPVRVDEGSADALAMASRYPIQRWHPWERRGCAQRPWPSGWQPRQPV